jgi:hypothetical protein
MPHAVRQSPPRRHHAVASCMPAPATSVVATTSSPVASPGILHAAAVAASSMFTVASPHSTAAADQRVPASSNDQLRHHGGSSQRTTGSSTQHSRSSTAGHLRLHLLSPGFPFPFPSLIVGLRPARPAKLAVLIGPPPHEKWPNRPCLAVGQARSPGQHGPQGMACLVGPAVIRPCWAGPARWPYISPTHLTRKACKFAPSYIWD